MEYEEIVNEILEICQEKNIRVLYILKLNSKDIYNIDYFIAPPQEDVGGPVFGGCYGYSYNSKTKKLKKESIGSAFLIYDKDKYTEIYRDKQIR